METCLHSGAPVCGRDADRQSYSLVGKAEVDLSIVPSELIPKNESHLPVLVSWVGQLSL